MKQSMLSLGILGACIFFSALVSSSPNRPVGPFLKPFPKKDLKNCDCFTVSGPDPGYFQHYKLWDFRAVPLTSDLDSIHDSDDTYDDDDDDNEDEDSDDDDDDGMNFHDMDEEYDSKSPDEKKQEINLDTFWFFDSSFYEDWTAQQWERPRNPQSPVNMINSKHNVFFTRNHGQRDSHATFLILRTIRHDNYTSTAEIETQVRNIYRCSMRVRFRILPASVSVLHPAVLPLRQPQHWMPPANDSTVSGNATSLVEAGRPLPGACVGIFTYRFPNCESDIEILTNDPSTRVRYANQPDYDPETDEMIPGASTVADVDVPWTEWSTHRLDWLSGVSRWWVNKKPQGTKTYRVPNMESRLVINLWSDGGDWTGDMRLGDTIYLGIEYIELAYNRSSDGIKYVPPSQRHGGHQLPLANLSTSESEDIEDDPWGPETKSLTAVKKKKKKYRKCKKGKKGRKCRKKHHHHKKPEKPKKPSNPHCDRVCNIDDLQLGQRGLHD
jgi:hypothetical protein